MQFHEGPTDPALLPPVDSANQPGILTATPGLAPMELNRVRFSGGASNAAALASRWAAFAYESLSATGNPVECVPLDSEYYTVLLKALIVNGASWGDAGPAIEKAFPEYAADKRRLKSLKQQFLGYGEVNMSRWVSATERRVTLLGWAKISDWGGRQFDLPLPPSLASRTELRRLTATIARLTPTNHKHRNYRNAQLWIDVPGDGIGTQTCGLDAASARNGRGAVP